MGTRPKVVRVGLGRIEAKLVGSRKKQNKWNRSGFLLLTLAIIGGWRRETFGLDEVIDSFFIPLTNIYS